MPPNHDTLNIGSIRLRKEFPIAGVQSRSGNGDIEPANHPEAAAAARARIAAIPDTLPLADTEKVPATPTADLVTDRRTLARQAMSAPAVTKPKLPSAWRPMLGAVGVFALAMLIFKAPIIFNQLKYSVEKPTTEQTATVTPASDIIPPDNTITIPKINVHAPVVYEPSIKEDDIQRALQNGVVHYGNTAKPGEIGNVAIFGHSSNDWWEPGNYKFVFVLLDKLSPGDRVTVDYQSKRYTYEVTGSRVVEPTEVSVLNPTSEPTLSIITCSPPGTSLRRLVVTAKQIDPDPGKARASTADTSQTQSTTDGNLPSSAPSFSKQLERAWNGIVHGFSSLFGGDGIDAPGTSPTSSGNGTSAGQLPASK